MPIFLLLLVLLLLGAAIFFFFPILGDGSQFRPSLGAFQESPETRPSVDEHGHKVFGRAHVEKRGGLYLLFLEGSPYEMGYQHGVLLREEIHKGVLPLHANPTENQAPFSRMPAWKRKILSRYFDWAYFRPMLAHAPHGFLEELKGLSDGCGVPFAEVFRGNMLSEFNMNTVPLVRRNLIRQIEGGCTSFAAFGSMTVNGNMVVGRNTDYSGGGLWDRYQVVFFYQPQEGYRFVNVGSAGLLKCNSCMNERGLVLGAHFMYSDDVSPKGVGFTAFEFEIMKKAATVEEVFDIVCRNPRNGAFGYLVASGENGDAGVIEGSAGYAGLRRPEKDAIWETNFMTTPETRPVDLLIRYKMYKNPLSRVERMRMMLETHAGSIDPHMAAGFMGDQWNMGAMCDRPVGHVIGTLSNLTSVVFTPANFDFWVADGPMPVCNNPFTGFNMMAEFKGEPAEIKPAALMPNPYVNSEAFSVLRQYAQVKIMMTIPPFDAAGALRLLEEVILRSPQEGAYRLIAARMYLRRGETSGAAAHLRILEKCVLSTSEMAQAALLQGFSCDLSESRQDALKFYRKAVSYADENQEDVLKTVNPLILANARKYMNTPFTISDAYQMDLSMDLGSQHDI